jgi:hypothetical protein
MPLICSKPRLPSFPCSTIHPPSCNFCLGGPVVAYSPILDTSFEEFPLATVTTITSAELACSICHGFTARIAPTGNTVHMHLIRNAVPLAPDRFHIAFPSPNYPVPLAAVPSRWPSYIYSCGIKCCLLARSRLSTNTGST